MSSGMQLGQSQRLAQMQVLSPQMQQSLAILQAPVLELKALVDQELEQNPVLEEVATTETEQEQQEGKPDREKEETANLADPAEPPADTQFDPAQEKGPADPVDDFQAEFDKLVQLDQEWRDHFAQTNLPARHSAEDEERRQFMFDSLVAETSLQEILLEQVRTSDLPADRRPIAEMIVGNIDDYGYLQSSVEELAFSTGTPAEQILEVLKVIQTFQPPGVGARDLRECLLLQLERAGKQSSPEYRVVRDHMDALGRRRYPEIARALGVDVEDAQAIAERISHLDPRPGRAFLPESAGQYIVPEVFVQKVGEEYVVSTNNDQIPHLRISNTYKDLMSDAGSTAEVRQYIRNKIQAGKFLIKSLHQRQQTILNIAREIVARQREFMEKGVSGLKPLTMAAVAEVVGVHETTVSRAVSGKYMETPQGVFEMRYFFTSGFTTAGGESVSNTSIKEILLGIIKDEDTASPLSDETIVKMLTEKGIPIARRTVAKYRAELNILPSNLRRVY
ncbi:MAG: RNA polymerase factor sigma-54 [Verrucomicrobia bacterium]|nr:RNA polymerase factor sigma-54 [Verrucomicrobiota bacterium]